LGLTHINIGIGKDLSISELAQLVRKIVGFSGEMVFDISKPDGILRKLLDVSRLENLGWSSNIDLKSGLTMAYDWYMNHLQEYEAN